MTTTSTIFAHGERNRGRRGHEFLPATLAASIPALYETETTALDDTVLHAHYFYGAMDWYVAELDHDTGVAFGHADLGMQCPEWGYFDLGELEAIEHRIIERDCFFSPITARDLWPEGHHYPAGLSTGVDTEA